MHKHTHTQRLKDRMERERKDMEDACDRMRLAFEQKVMQSDPSVSSRDFAVLSRDYQLWGKRPLMQPSLPFRNRWSLVTSK